MNAYITSLQNKRVKDAIKLRRSRGRKAQDRILIDGAREVLRAMEAGVDILEVFVCEEQVQRTEARSALEIGHARRTELVRVTPEVFRKLAFGAREEGLIAVAARPRSNWPTLPLTDNPLVVVLEHVEKPGNLGGVVRTADAVGAAVLVADPAADLYNPHAVRASLGAIFHVPVAAAASREILAWLQQRGMQVLAARVDGAMEYTEADYARPTAIVLGSEAAGLSETWSERDIPAISLPLLGRVDSLNVSVTAGVLLYEALRQRRARSQASVR